MLYASVCRGQECPRSGFVRSRMCYFWFRGQEYAFSGFADKNVLGPLSPLLPTFAGWKDGCLPPPKNRFKLFQGHALGVVRFSARTSLELEGVDDPVAPVISALEVDAFVLVGHRNPFDQQ